MSRKQPLPQSPTLFDDAQSALDDEIVIPALPATWQNVLGAEFNKPYFRQLQQFLDKERVQHTIFPPTEDVYNALIETPFDQVRVLIVGQDPYHDEGQAHGLCFSVPPGVNPPPSLKNILRELKSDIGGKEPNNGCLAPWAKQGVLLINTVLTVRAHQPGSHQKKGWEQFTDQVIREVSAKSHPVVFVLWGAHALKKLALIDAKRHVIVSSAHPSPLSARSGFLGSRPFSRINSALREKGSTEIDWQLPDL